MQKIHKQDLDGKCAGGAIYNVHYIGCRFQGVSFGFGHASDFGGLRSATNIRIERCIARKLTIGPAILSDFIIDDIDSDLVITWGTFLRHVAIRGRFDKLMIHGIPSPRATDMDIERYCRIAASFYAGVDWALDISEAQFVDFSIRTNGVPIHLIKRDVETQVILDRNNLLTLDKKLGLSSLTETTLSVFLREGGDNFLLVAPKRDKDVFGLICDDIKILRAAGVAR